MASLFDMLQDEFFKTMVASDFHRTGVISKRCPKCGQTYADFDRTGHFGCASCYDTFSAQIEALLERMQGSAIYKGRFPAHGHRLGNAERIAELERELKKAVEEQQFELASTLRDELLALKEGER